MVQALLASNVASGIGGSFFLRGGTFDDYDSLVLGPGLDSDLPTPPVADGPQLSVPGALNLNVTLLQVSSALGQVGISVRQAVSSFLSGDSGQFYFVPCLFGPMNEGSERYHRSSVEEEARKHCLRSLESNFNFRILRSC